MPVSLHSQSIDAPPDFVPTEYEILYIFDGVDVDKKTIAAAKEKMYRDQKNASYELTGKASYYAEKFHGRTTANGEKFDMNALTAAHTSLPFNSIVRVTNLANRKSVVVRINDRGPYVGDRIIDLSKKAAEELGIIASGVAQVGLEIVKLGEIKKRQAAGSSVAEKERNFFINSADTVNIQVASYSKRVNARRLIDRLLEHGITAVIEEKNGYHRVIVQGLRKNAYAQVSEKLLRLGFAQILVRAN